MKTSASLKRNNSSNICKKKICSLARSQDIFGDSFNMKLDSGDESIKTLSGSLCSLLLLMVTILYASLKFDILLTKKDVRIVTAVEDMYFSDTDEFDYSDGLNIAASLWTGSEESLDLTYGELVFV